jgi:uncharacterized membrane protein
LWLTAANARSNEDEMQLKHTLQHYFLVRPRLLFALALSLLCFFLLPRSLSPLYRALLSWNALAWVYLCGLWWLMLRTDSQHIRHIARAQDESASTVLLLVCVASIVSLVSILFELSTAAGGWNQSLHLALVLSTLFAGWLLLPTAFGLHYAHLYYLSATPVLQFPERPPAPSYWDFLYFSFTIAVASQTADVSVANSALRRVVLMQSVLSFVFNLAILGLFVNVGASLIK